MTDGGVSKELNEPPSPYITLLLTRVDLSPHVLCSFPNRYAELGIFSVVSMGIYTVFFWGLMDLAKVFLDPLDNDGCVQMDLTVLIREVNGGSHRWMKGANKFPH